MKIFVSGLVITLVGFAPAAAQNLLANPGFDTADQLTGWVCTMADGVPSWSPEDRLGFPTSGSVQHDVDASANNGKIWCSQCVPVTAMESYVASGWFFWPDDPDVSQAGSTRLSVYYYSDPDCLSFLDFGPTITQNPPTLDTWHHVATDETVAPSGAVAAIAFFNTWQNFTGQPVRARLDDLAFTATRIFSDGFETSGIGEWSDSTP